jgi:hypothetical protein
MTAWTTTAAQLTGAIALLLATACSAAMATEHACVDAWHVPRGSGEVASFADLDPSAAQSGSYASQRCDPHDVATDADLVSLERLALVTRGAPR